MNEKRITRSKLKRKVSRLMKRYNFVIEYHSRFKRDAGEIFGPRDIATSCIPYRLLEKIVQEVEEESHLFQMPHENAIRFVRYREKAG